MVFKCGMYRFFSHSKNTVAETHRELRNGHRNASPRESRCSDWFRQLAHVDFNVGVRSPEGKPKTFETAQLQALPDEYTSQM